MPSMVILGLRAVQLLFGFIVLGLSAYVAHWYNADTLTASPSQIDWLLFCSLFTILSIVYLEVAPRAMPKIVHPMAVVALELLNALFYFAGFIALSVFISKLLFCRGSVCGSARADVAFGAMQFLAWTATAIFAVRDVMKGVQFPPSRRCQLSPRRRLANEGGPAALSVPDVVVVGVLPSSKGDISSCAYSNYTDIPLSPYEYRPSFDGSMPKKSPLLSTFDRRRFTIATTMSL